MSEKLEEILEIIFGVIIFGILFIVLPGIGGYIETHYTREAKVVSIENEIIVVEDKIGMLWEFEGDSFEINDDVKMKMFNNYTDETIKDDEIISIKRVDK